ncbi:MAG TPA: sn-glycerol-1-phosphate dehydrogenase [Anaerolineaceae bacterium]|nr:sn-glycerol-1-phosphate dehydrogenase [Anaerolineaceae bacterium]
MSEIVLPEVTIGPDALEALASFCSQGPFNTFHLVADPITYNILGRTVETTLNSSGLKGIATILEGFPLLAGGDAVLQILTAASPLSDVFIAVGSGTVTDVVRFASRSLNRPFISVPTAPSVDGYTSPTSPLIVAQVKQSFPGQLPLAVFAHLPTLCEAPAEMIAAGFGDMIGKATALADWRLGHLLWNEPYDEAIASNARAALQRCIDSVSVIASRDPQGIRVLMECQLDSGLNMAKAGSSRPASGAEHHLAHYWEMKLIWENRPPLLHGLKVGFASLWIADLYARFQRFNLPELKQVLDKTPLPNAQLAIQDIKTFYSRNSDRIINEQRHFLDLDETRWAALKVRIYENWDEILAIVKNVPRGAELEIPLKVIKFPLMPSDLNLSETDITEALSAAHYLRDRLTVLKLLWLVPGLFKTSN